MNAKSQCYTSLSYLWDDLMIRKWLCLQIQNINTSLESVIVRSKFQSSPVINLVFIVMWIVYRDWRLSNTCVQVSNSFYDFSVLLESWLAQNSKFYSLWIVVKLHQQNEVKASSKSAVNTLQVPAPPAQRIPATTRECVCSCGRVSPVTAPWPPTGGRSAVTVSEGVLHLSEQNGWKSLL